jgi:hypothetical protein
MNALDKVPDNAAPLVLRKGHGGAYLPLMWKWKQHWTWLWWLVVENIGDSSRMLYPCNVLWSTGNWHSCKLA